MIMIQACYTATGSEKLAVLKTMMTILYQNRPMAHCPLVYTQVNFESCLHDNDPKQKSKSKWPKRKDN